MISIIMPVYNSSLSLTKSIKSIINQTDSNWELIAINDGSLDDSLSILNRFSEMDNRISVYSQENQGPGVARNLGISKARGEYIAFLDSDDFYSSTFVNDVNEIIHSDKPDLIFYDCIEEYSSGRSIICNRVGRFRNEDKEKLLRLQMVGTMPWGMVKVIRRTLLQEGNYCFSSFSVGEEAIISFDILHDAKVISFLQNAEYHYVQSDNGQHKKGSSDPWIAVVRKMKDHLKGIDEYSKYEKTINTFALRSLIICLYRISVSKNSLHVKFVQMKDKIKHYESEFNLTGIEKDILSSSDVLLSLLIRIRFLFPIYIASQLRDRNKRKQ